MDYRKLAGMGVIAGLCVTALSCAQRRSPAYAVSLAPGVEVVAPSAPPPNRHEVIPAPTSHDLVWVPGYWFRTNNRWIWVPGRQELRPRAEAVYVPSQWTHTERGYVYVPGAWR